MPFAKFVQGLAHSYVALSFDRGYVFSENVASDTSVSFHGWGESRGAGAAAAVHGGGGYGDGGS